MKKRVFKALLSTLLLLGLLYLAATGAMMYFAKTGVVLGVSRNALRVSHFWVALTTCACAAMHFILNFRIYLAEMRPKKVRESVDRKDRGRP